MNERTLRALIDAGAVKRVRIIADAALFHIEADTATATHIAQTGKGQPRTWSTLDAAAKWLRVLGIGTALIDVSRWRPEQRALKLPEHQS